MYLICKKKCMLVNIDHTFYKLYVIHCTIVPHYYEIQVMLHFAIQYPCIEKTIKCHMSSNISPKGSIDPMITCQVKTNIIQVPSQ